MCFSSNFSVFGFPFQLTASIYPSMKFSIFHTSRDIMFSPKLSSHLVLNSCSFSPQARFSFLTTCGVKRHSREVKSPTGRLVPHEALLPKICYNDVRCRGEWGKMPHRVTRPTPSPGELGGHTCRIC